MVFNPDDSSTVPMSLRMKRVLTAIKKLSPTEGFQLLVRAGLMSQAEADAAASRHITEKKRARKAKTRPNESAPSEKKPVKR